MNCNISQATSIRYEQRSTTMAFIARQSRTLKAYCCLRGLEDEVMNDFCLAPIIITFSFYESQEMTRSRDDHQIFSLVSFLLFDLLWQLFQREPFV